MKKKRGRKQREKRKSSCLRSREKRGWEKEGVSQYVRKCGGWMMSPVLRPPSEAIDGGVSVVFLFTPRTFDSWTSPKAAGRDAKWSCPTPGCSSSSWTSSSPPYTNLLKLKLWGHGGHRSHDPSPRPAARRDGSPKRHPCTKDQRQVKKWQRKSLFILFSKKKIRIQTESKETQRQKKLKTAREEKLYESDRNLVSVNRSEII